MRLQTPFLAFRLSLFWSLTPHAEQALCPVPSLNNDISSVLPGPFHCSRQLSRLIPKLKKDSWSFAFCIDLLLVISCQWMKTLLFSMLPTWRDQLGTPLLNGYDLDFKKYPHLQLICKGIKRAQGCSTRVRLPITIQYLKLFLCLLATPHISNYDSLMIWAAMTLAFFGFMRLGELTRNSKFSLETHLSPSGVRFLPSLSQPDYMSIQVKISKTDPFRIGHTLLIAKRISLSTQ